MADISSPFLKGVLTSAQHTGFRAQTLRLDLSDVIKASNHLTSSRSDLSRIACNAIVTDRWLSYREQFPRRTIRPEQLSRVEIGTATPLIQKYQGYGSSISSEYPYLDELLLGTQIALPRMGVARDGGLFDEDRTALLKAFPEIRGVYLSKGLSQDDAAMLALNEVLPLWINYPLRSLHISGIFDQPRYGLLEVRSTPTAALVFVGQQEAGYTPLQPTGYLAGRYVVAAEKGKLSARQEGIVIRPAEKTTIKLTLK